MRWTSPVPKACSDRCSKQAGTFPSTNNSTPLLKLTGTTDKLDSFLEAIGTASILETVRSGVTGIARGDKVLSI